jgi:hypothetical protein
MNIDERIARLTERHEALARTVGLMGAHMSELTTRTIQAMYAINRLAHIAAARDGRLNDHD